MLYFIKDDMIHRFPVPHRCGTIRENEVLRDTILYGVEECPYCLRRWPQDGE